MSKECEYFYCDSWLFSPEELATGLCDRHYTAIAEPKNVLGVCWVCGSIVSITPKSRVLQKFLDRSKPLVLFCKGCRNCQHGKTELENAWMTINETSPSTASVTPSGEIISYRNLKGCNPK